MLTRDELMRHEAAGITTAAFPKTCAWAASTARRATCTSRATRRTASRSTVPIYALNQVSEERCEWLVPGMLKDKVLALLKSLHQRPRSRLVPLPDYADEFCRATPVRAGRADRRAAEGRARAHPARRAAQRLQARQLPPHLFMNFRVVDEHGRQLGMGRNLAALKAELGAQARAAFQALAALKLRDAAPRRRAPQPARSRASASGTRRAAAAAQRAPAAAEPQRYTAGPSASCPS